jgi:hypothetical protein
MRREYDLELPADTKLPGEGFGNAYRSSAESTRHRFTGWIKLLGGLLLTGVGVSAMWPPSPVAAVLLVGVPLTWSGFVQTITGRHHSLLRICPLAPR